MKNLSLILFVALLASFACARGQPPAIAIRGVTVVDVMDGSLHSEHTVLVEGNRITAVGHPDALAAGCSTAAEAERKRFAGVLANYSSLPESEKFLAMFRHVRALYDSGDPAACASAIEA
jgi:hypothetical protein